MAIALLSPLSSAAPAAVNFAQSQPQLTDDALQQQPSYSDDMASLLAEMEQSIAQVEVQVEMPAQQLPDLAQAEGSGVVVSMLPQLLSFQPEAAELSQHLAAELFVELPRLQTESTETLAPYLTALAPDAPTQPFTQPALSLAAVVKPAVTQSLITTFPAEATLELAAEQRHQQWSVSSGLSAVLPPPEKVSSQSVLAAVQSAAIPVEQVSEVIAQSQAVLSAQPKPQTQVHQGQNQALLSLLNPALNPTLSAGLNLTPASLMAEQAAASTTVAAFSSGTASPLPVWQAEALPAQSQQWGQRLVQLLADKVDLQLGLAVNKAMIRLDPPSLGSIELSVQLEGERLTVQMHSSNAQLRDAMGQGLEQLRASLQQKLGADIQIELRLSTDSSSQQQQKQQQQRSQATELNFLAEPETQQLSQAQANSHNLVNQLV